MFHPQLPKKTRGNSIPKRSAGILQDMFVMLRSGKLATSHEIAHSKTVFKGIPGFLPAMKMPFTIFTRAGMDWESRFIGRHLAKYWRLTHHTLDFPRSFFLVELV